VIGYSAHKMCHPKGMGIGRGIIDLMKRLDTVSWVRVNTFRLKCCAIKKVSDYDRVIFLQYRYMIIVYHYYYLFYIILCCCFLSIICYVITATQASDYWAFGCIIYKMLLGFSPFAGGSEYLTFQKVSL
jgi:serine/threonine protein kinase